ncbi:MAG: hypothetical protein GY771_12740, partial [bacterium]|nr:hypothetical protein [bacterium]
MAEVEKSYGASSSDYNNAGFPGLFVVNYENENNSLYRNDGGYRMNENAFSNTHEVHDAHDTGENLHGPNMEGDVGSMSTPTGTNIGRVQTSTLVDTYYIYSFDGKLMAEYDHDGNCVKEYIYMGGQLIAEYQPQTSKYYYYASDQINSTRKVLDDNGDTVHSTSYGPYGQILDT